MTTIKSCTDLNQSKKLAEILPIESADIHYWKRTWKENDYAISVGHSKELQEGFESKCIEYIPCWSLSALLDVLPPYLFEFERGIDLNVYPNLNGRGWHCSYMPNCIENMKTDKFKLITSGDTIVDACYEMIIKLHEQKVL